MPAKLAPECYYPLFLMQHSVKEKEGREVHSGLHTSDRKTLGTTGKGWREGGIK